MGNLSYLLFSFGIISAAIAIYQDGKSTGITTLCESARKCSQAFNH